jgi:hypothetical protein
VKLGTSTHKGNAFSFDFRIECDKSGNQSRINRKMQAYIRLDILKDLTYKTISQSFSFILVFVLLILFKLLSYSLIFSNFRWFVLATQLARALVAC